MNEENRKTNKTETVHEQPMTYNDYAAMEDDGNRYELADGKLELMSPGPPINHQFFVKELYSSLTQSCSSQYFVMFAPLDVILSPTEVRQPDIMMVHRSRIHILSQRGIEGPPDLVVEIISPSTVKRDRLDKHSVYARYGIPEYWLADPANGSLEQYVLTQETYRLAHVYSGDETICSEKLPCVSFTMMEILQLIPDV
jgi:Uma2 family endonuclease